MMTRQRLLMAGVWLLLAGSVTACAPSLIALDPGVRAQLPSASAIHVIVYPADPPPLMTAKALAAGSMFGAIGGAVVGARAGVIGKELMAKHNVEDLSTQLAVTLIEQLKPTLPTIERASITPASREIDDLKKTGLRPFVLDIGTSGSIFYYGSNLARYRLIYSALVRLVDTEQGRVLWQGFCKLTGGDDPTQAPTLNELEADDGIAYRRLLAEATSTCATDLLNQFHGKAVTAREP